MSRFPAIELRGAVVVVTGGGRGIGLSTARAFAAKGAKVVIGELEESDGDAAAREVGAGSVGLQVDVGSPDSCRSFVGRTETEVGPIDVLVNNAGIMPVGGLLEESESVAAATFRVNYWAHYHALRLVAPLMIDRGRGHIVNVTSAAARLHSPGLATYVASKHAAAGLSRSAREELMPYGVSVTAVMPSAVRTQLVHGIPFAAWERLAIISPDAVARVIVGTVRNRPASVAVPRGLGPALNLPSIVPERLWLIGRAAVKADRTMGPIDRAERREYDGRIHVQVAKDDARSS